MAEAVTGEEVRRLPVRLQLAQDEALDSFLERHAAANHLDAPSLLRRVCGDTSHLPIAPTSEVLKNVATLTGERTSTLKRHSVAAHAGVAPRGDETDGAGTGWRRIGRAWAPGRGSQLCPACLTEDGVWRVTWRHPWATVCLTHRTWLHATCPTCQLPFRMNRASPAAIRRRGRPYLWQPGRCSRAYLSPRPRRLGFRDGSA